MNITKLYKTHWDYFIYISYNIQKTNHKPLSYNQGYPILLKRYYVSFA